eukprot:Tamp_10212.p1 GENE.Tamp_10212~~Tamp_10212.p1  ORF type:complete len:497 (-),score=82.38 Tamp_10212:577-2067(-)
MSEKRPVSVALMRGHLWKSHHAALKGADKRYFELHGTELRYFERDNSAIANRIVNVAQAKWEDGTKTASKLNFTLHTPKDALAQSYKFACDSEKEFAEWKAAIEEAAQKEPNKEAYPAATRVNLVALVNGKSGGKQGAELIKKIRKHLGDQNVIDIMERNPNGGILAPKGAMTMHANDGGSTRFLVCGGDGTVGWALQDLDKLRDSGIMTEDVAVSVLPLGTGNDMARTLRCGGGYAGEKLKPILDKCAQGRDQKLDRWKVNIKASGQDSNQTEEEFIMCNYFSIGWDAKIARRFHCLREAKPHLFKNRSVNKGWYAYFSMCHLLGNLDMSQAATLEVDGKVIAVPKGVVSFNVVNIPSYSGGTNLWGTQTSDSFAPQLTDDGKLEVVGYTGALHMLGIRGGLRKGIRIAQGAEVVVKTKARAEGGPDASKGVCCQVDGEPYVVDGKGFHKEADYMVSSLPDTASVDLCVRITHHAVSTLITGPPGGGCCTQPAVE